MNQQKALLKICFLSGARYFCPLDATTEKKFRALKALGKLFIIGFSQDLSPQWFVQHARFYLLPRLPVAALRYIEMFVVGSVVACWLILRYGVQVLVAQSPYEGFAAAVAKTIAGWLGHRVVLVVESHGDFEESLFLQRSIMFPRLYRLLMRRSAHFALKRADLSRAVSKSTKEQLERWVQQKRNFQFPTWTDIEVFLQGAAKESEGSGQNILYAGVLIPRKGVHHLINAFASVANDFPRARLSIVGHEENKIYAAELKEEVKRLGLDGRVQFVGQVQQADLAAWMRRVCVFVLPTYSEGLPRVIFEAMAAGLPVVASNVSGIPDIVQDGVTGFLVQPGDEEKLVERIRWLLRCPDEARQMGERGRAFAERFFSIEVYAEGYRQLFEAAQALIVQGSEHAPSAI
jgi:glycosyltransferase involved in cell wall biosynthesis